jgi:NAD(P)-dependent dehydrogenase (short-subunit alcohol dehydrogenase family)
VVVPDDASADATIRPLPVRPRRAEHVGGVTGPERIRRRLTVGWWWRGPADGELRAAVGGRTVLITGASSGIGEASALRLAGAGARVLLVARRQSELERVRDAIKTTGGAAWAYPADLSDESGVAALLARVLTDHGHIDVVVNNAGKSIRRPVDLAYHRFHDYTRTINVNYLGPVRLMLGLLPHMRARGTGHLINVSTISVDMPAPYWSAYSASKAAFEVWLRCVAPEARLDGVRTTSIHFPLVHTAMSAPTRHFRNVPGLSADEAAQAVCRAIVRRPRVLGPWWMGVNAAGGHLAPAMSDRVMTMYARVEARRDRRRAAR